MPKQPSSPLVLALKYFRTAAGLNVLQLARVLGVNKSLISRYERGEKPLTRGQLEALIAPLGYPSEAVDVFLTAHGLIHPEPIEQAPPPVALTPEELHIVDRAAMAAGWAAGRAAALAVRTERVRRWREEKTDHERLKAEEFFESLAALPTTKERRDLVNAFPKLRNWALAEIVCEASVKSVSHDAGEALELAKLAVFIAERVPGEDSWRSRLLGYCWAHVANALRVSNDLAGADRAFARAWVLWREGSDSAPDLLDEWLIPAMEASLRRDQRRFPEALELLGRARTSRGGTSSSASMAIILNESNVFSLMGDAQRSLAALTDAAQLCEASGDRRRLLVLRFNIAEDLCQLERFGEAAQLLPQVRELALQQANELDLIRVGWLTAKVAAGQGRTEEAIAGFEQVSRDFRDRELAYDAALSSLDLSVVCLKAGRTAQVRKLADSMVWIFRAKGIAREALAALKVFCDAARQESATVKLALEVITKIEKARHSAPSQRRGRG